MLIADGVTPSNEGRGYILRRLMRRAIRAMRLLGVTGAWPARAVPGVCEAMKGAFPYVGDDFERISRIAYAEEKAFLHTIETGTERLKRQLPLRRTAPTLFPVLRRLLCTTPTASRLT